jgi:hypothetical protein
MNEDMDYDYPGGCGTLIALATLIGIVLLFIFKH